MKTRLLAVGLLSALVLTACGDDGPVRGGTAVRVGDATISTQALARQVEELRAGAGSRANDLPAFQREVLSALLAAEIAEQAAQDEGVTIGDDDLAGQRSVVASQLQVDVPRIEQALLGGGFEGFLVRNLLEQAAYYSVLADALTADEVVPQAALDAAYREGAGEFDRVRISQIQLPDLATARSVFAEARGLDAAAFQRLASERTLDEASKAAGGVVEPLARSIVVEQQTAVPGVPRSEGEAGDTVIIDSPQGGASFVVRVLERQVVTPEQALPKLRAASLREEQEAALRAAIDEVEVEVNPRFGRWDPAQRVVVSDADGPGRKLSLKTGATTGPSLGSADPDAAGGTGETTGP